MQDKRDETPMKCVYAGPEFFEKKYPDSRSLSDATYTMGAPDVTKFEAVYRGPEPAVPPMLLVYRGPLQQDIPAGPEAFNMSAPPPVPFSKRLLQAVTSYGVVKCTECGQQLIGNSKFCSFCGEKLPEEPQYICTGCGTELKGKPKFCSECGSPTIWRTVKV